jgi:hypothetical protein
MINSAAKQSILTLRLPYGLLRGACHRARIRATRWLAMTAVIAPPVRSSLLALDGFLTLNFFGLSPAFARDRDGLAR